MSDHSTDRKYTYLLPEAGTSLWDATSQIEVDLITQALRRTNGNQAKAALLLRIPKPTLWNKIQKLGIDPGSKKGRPKV